MAKQNMNKQNASPNVIDLTHLIHEDMPVYPGTDEPVLETPFSVEKDGFAEMKLAMWSHTGTHMDSPAHMLANGKTLDRFPAHHFTGSGCVIPVTGLEPGSRVEVETVNQYANLISRSDFVLFHSGWDRFWGRETYFNQYPYLSEEAALRLCDFSLKGVGLDMISVDPVGSTKMPAHRILLEREIVIIENLTNLQSLPQSGFTFCCFPLRIKGADGSPIRAVALLSHPD